MNIPVADIQRTVDRYLRSEASASMALMELVQLTEDPAALARALPTLAGEPAKLGQLARDLADNEAGCHTMVKMIRQRLDSTEVAGDAEEGIERCRKLFDASVAQSEESSVALYSLGSPELLAAATDEVIGVLEDWGVLGRHRDALEIGCGIGRLMVPLCSLVRSVVGTDVSSGMVSAATRRLEGFSNASVQMTAGQDLSEFGSGSMDLVYSSTRFPTWCFAGTRWSRATFERSGVCSGPEATSSSSTTLTDGLARTPMPRCLHSRTQRNCRSYARMSLRFEYGMVLSGR